MVSLKTSGVDNISDASDTIVKVEGSDIIVSGSAGRLITITEINGSVIYRATSQGYSRINAPFGVYIVNVDGITKKIII